MGSEEWSLWESSAAQDTVTIHTPSTSPHTIGLMMMALLRPLVLMTLLACSTSSPVEQDILGDMEDSLVVEGREMDIMDGESSDVGVDNVQMKAEEDEDEEEDEVDRMGEMESTNEE